MRTHMRIVVIDDHPLFVRGLELLLPDVSDSRATVVASTSDAASAAGLVRRTVPDLVLIDLHMPPPGGLRAITAVRQAEPRSRVLAMSGDADPAAAVEALRAGAEGFLPKSSEPGDLVHPLLAALEGWAVLPGSVLAALTAEAGGGRIEVRLNDDERDLLRMIAAGLSTLEIAARLHLSERTVKRQTATLLRRLRVSSRTEAAALAGSAGLL
ncbi:response regulator [Actinoplanes sp. NPDC051343]|uniref:response regulator n=1 Tax=Actinoplanes sp. NPDC051343 TaxID=3363906 RepID=UPI00379A301C